MKKTITILSILSCIICSCDKNQVGYNISERLIKKAGMEYIIYEEGMHGIFIVNITKDSLEVEQLKSNLLTLKK